MNRFDSVTKPLMWFMALLLAALVAGCGGAGQSPILGGGGVGVAPALPPGTVTPTSCSLAGPKVISSNPTANNQFVTTSTAGVTGKRITATFDVPMVAATIDSATPGALSTFTLKDMTASPGTIVSGTVLLDGTKTVATLTTTAALTANTWYTASITTAAMALPTPPGTPLSCSYAWNFKTAAVAAAGLAQVNLGTASTYGIMAWDAMTVNAGSHIYGDVALPGGVIASVTGPAVKNLGSAPHLNGPALTNSAGVTPAEVNTTDNGTLTLAQLTQLQADLNAAYLDLVGRAPPAGAPLVGAGGHGGTFVAASPDLTGIVLSPGIYAAGSTYALSSTSGPLVLDAGGNPDAVFIFQSADISTTTGSVLLQGGAQSKNVFWVVTNNATIGDGLGSTPFFQGTILAGHVIVLKAFTNVEGRMLAGALGIVSGALTLTGTNTITVPK